MTIRNTRTGGQILIDQLVAQGVERVTCVPGESYLAALDALHDSPIDVMICRAEGGAAMMAEAYGKLTGRPGICFVTRGPGATNASHGVHIAMQDSTPMILFVGQVDTGMREREAFQELDYKAVFGSLAKWAVEIDRPDRIPELVARAFRVAMQGRPGPVVISLPENMLTETAAVADAMRIEPAVSWPAPADIERVGAMLASAKAPLVILGGSRWTEKARELPGTFQYGQIMTWLRDRLPKDAIVCNGAGNYAGWIHRHHRFHSFAAQLAPTSGSMGYGVPAAVLAKRQYPDRTVIAFAGDGCFLMNGQEFATAVQYDAPLVVIIVDNAQYGTIRMHQERDYPGRVVGTQLKNPDFAMYAKAFGGHGERVERTEEFAPAFERALASGKPSILHCIIDPRAMSVGKDFAPAVKA